MGTERQGWGCGNGDRDMGAGLRIQGYRDGDREMGTERWGQRDGEGDVRMGMGLRIQGRGQRGEDGDMEMGTWEES